MVQESLLTWVENRYGDVVATYRHETSNVICLCGQPMVLAYRDGVPFRYACAACHRTPIDLLTEPKKTRPKKVAEHG